jgi:hypothetical protein
MSAVIWANVLLALPFMLAWAGIPLWLTVKQPDTEPDFSAARAYLVAKAAAEAAQPEPALRPAA